MTILAAVLALLLQGAFAAAQAVNANGQCTGMTVTDFLSSDSDNRTNLTAWQNVTDGHLTFTTSGQGCVIIEFSGLGFVIPLSDNGGFGYLYVRTLLDGNALCMPANYNQIFQSGPYPGVGSTNSVTHICKNVPAGAHAVQGAVSQRPWPDGGHR